MSFSEARKGLWSSTPDNALLDFESLQESLNADTSLAFWAKWDQQLQKVCEYLEQALIDVNTLCNTECGPAVSLACWQSKQLDPDELENLFKVVEVNRTGFTELAESHDRKYSGSTPQRDARVQIFDSRAKRAVEALEVQAFIAVTDPRKNRTYVLLIALGVLMLVAIILAAVRPPQDTNLLVLASFGGFFAGFGNAGNDICNCVGTLVGSKVISLWNALLWGSVFEFIGCVALGSQVAKNITKDIIDVEDYADTPQLYSFSMVCTLFGCAGTTLLATAFGLPISATHGIIGGLIITGIVGNGFNSIGWERVGVVVCGWFGAPLVGGIMTLILYVFTHFLVLRHSNAAQLSKRYNPIFLWICYASNTLFMIIKGLKFLEVTPLWKAFVYAAVIGTILTILTMIAFCIKDKYFAKEEKTDSTSSTEQKDREAGKAVGANSEVKFTNGTNGASTEMADIQLHSGKNGATDGGMQMRGQATDRDEKNQDVVVETQAGIPVVDNHGVPELDNMLRLTYRGDPAVTNPVVAAKVATILDQQKNKEDPVEDPFNFPLILSGMSLAIAHGGNDVGNAVGPFAAVLAVAQDGEVAAKPDPPIWALLVGAIAFLTGILLIGRHTIKVVGNQITQLTASKAFSVQIGAAIAILGSSTLGLPVSTSQCLVGSVVGGAIASKWFGGDGVNCGIMWKIFKAWLATIPFAMAVAVSIFGPFQGFFD